MTQAPGSTRNSFDSPRATRYDQEIPNAVPGYAALHRLAVPLLRRALPGEASILVLGAGTGAEVLALAAAAPAWRFTAVEPAAAMAAVARERVAAAGLDERVRFHDGVVETLDPAPLHTAATALLTSQFIPDDGRRQNFFTAAAARLAPGAPLVVADLHTPADAAAGTVLRDGWAAFHRDHGMDDAALARYLAFVAREFHPLTEARLEAVLAQAGFGRPMRFFQALGFAGWWTVRL